MTQLFKNNDTIRNFQIENGKVLTTITLGDYKVTNPTLEQFLSSGWKEHTIPEIEPEPYVPTLEELVEQKIRERYTINQEFEVQRKRDTEPEAFQEYYDFVEECITWAREQIHKA